MATLGVVKSGKAYLGIHPQMPAAAQRNILQDAMPQLLLTIADLLPRAEEIAEGICDVLAIDDLQYPDDDIELPLRPEDPSTIFYTSGTTGQPKGVVKSHRAVLHRVWLSTQHDVIMPEDRQSLLTHSSFSAAESDIFCSLLQGARVCVFDLASEGFSAFRNWIDQEQITLLHPPVFLFRKFLGTLQGSNLFPSVRLVALAGDAVFPEDIREWKRHFAESCALLHRFSISETALLTVARIDREEPADVDFVSAGKPVADKFIELVDESGHEVAPGEVGEIVVRSRYLADGYWRHPEETAAAFRRDPDDPGQTIYRTGDRGRFLPDGSLMFLGRREHMAKIRGYRVDTREVESVLVGLEDISLATVLVRQEEDQDRLSAFVVMQDGRTFDARGIRERLKTNLPEWKIPSSIIAVASLPTTLSGKIDRQQLQSMAEPVAPESSDIEGALTDVWRVSLRSETVGLDDHFLDLGGDSIAAMVTLNWVERLYGVRLSVAEFYQSGTIRQLAQLLRARDGNTKPQDPAPRVSDAYLELLNQHSVEYVFVNPGTDTAPILESVARRQRQGQRVPKFVLCLHESVAMAAAHGYFMVSGRAQVVMVHVDVGTQNIGANLHNAQRGRAGMVICAGRSPYTMDGVEPGGRNRSNHWIQEQFDQASTVQGYVKWNYELTRARNLPLAVGRAFQIACTEPAGPVYLSMPREILMEMMPAPIGPKKRLPSPSSPAAGPAA
ncbi:MAG: AMP-binding protein, partial [Acidobacteriia bacterium]|nr:AMP-binding protein [Terriglobia bacterium]